MDIAVLCSLREGFSNVVLESMASGTPMVASRVGGNPEAIVDRVTGLLFDPAKPAELAQKLLVLLDDEGLRKSMGEAARERALNTYSRTKMLASYDLIYRSLLQEKSSA